MKIREQRMIQSAGDISKLDIINWAHLNGTWGNDVTAPINILNTWIASRAQYTIIECDLKRFPKRIDWPGWQHQGYHEYYGQLYWNMFHTCFKGEIEFSDSPDFSGTVLLRKRTVHFFGDVGKVSSSTFIFSLFEMNAGDLWISVVSDTTQIVIELMADVRNVYRRLLVEEFGIQESLIRPVREWR